MQSTVMARAITQQPAEIDPRSGKYLIFRLGNEEFGAGILHVREIMRMQEVTAVPQTPAYVKGVINLRGKVIPVMDLRSKFGMSAEEYTERTCIIVVRAHSAGVELPVGLVVDGVVEVLTLSAAEIEDAPDFGRGEAFAYLLGMAKVKGKVKILLDIEQVLSSGAMQGLESLLQ
ncbi:MAG TPA: chemotaxis protein CheW [Acidisarcina sp.]|nr:chemotaxis protein CheW [Acidisarcina sp.]